eukprot:scaffold27594_cov48-Attheya_sp.AAC.3
MKQDPDAVPGWGALEQVVSARFPNKGEDWAKRAVRQYKYFLELKKVHNDCAEPVLFSPSGPIDEIWHAHLSFTERYQHDVIAFCGGTEIIEHTPVIGEEALRRYVTAYQVHKARMEKKNEDVDTEFWPAPKEMQKQFNDDDDDDKDIEGDSDDQLSIRYSQFPQCG